MAAESDIANYSVDDFVIDVNRVISEKGTGPLGLEAIGNDLRRLVMEGGNLTKQGDPSPSGKGRQLYIDPNGTFRLGIGYFPTEEPTPVHSHYRWGVECVVSGEERFTVWERTDDNSKPGKAELKIISDGQIRRGDVRVWYDPPKNVHRQWAKGDQQVCLAILMGGDGQREHHFNLEDGSYEAAPPRVIKT